MSVIEVDTADLRAGGGKVSPKKSPLQVRTNAPLLSAEVLKEQLPAAAAKALLRNGPAQCDLRVGDSRAVSEACMYAGTAGRLGSNIPKFNFAPLYVNTRW